MYGITFMNLGVSVFAKDMILSTKYAATTCLLSPNFLGYQKVCICTYILQSWFITSHFFTFRVQKGMSSHHMQIHK